MRSNHDPVGGGTSALGLEGSEDNRRVAAAVLEVHSIFAGPPPIICSTNHSLTDIAHRWNAFDTTTMYAATAEGNRCARDLQDSMKNIQAPVRAELMPIHSNGVVPVVMLCW